MATLDIKINKNKIKIVIDRNKWERLMDALGLYNEDFIKSVKRGWRDYRRGRVYKIKDLKI
ncbi:MAG: hypothetical protein KatS3mg095_0984 [Candidatus Parcubacteria bacterium]|nr:MAG: hypothetical protein KatS3mg095_0984 [Candidatus Parcubacteria bacterium]